MQRIYTTSSLFIFKLSFLVLLIISLFLFLVKNSAASADLTPPVVSISSPQDGSIVTGIIQILANAWDNVAVDRVDFYTDGRFLGVGSSAPYSVLWDTTQEASDSSHVLFTQAFDTSGNEASSSAVWVTVDNTSPYVSLDRPFDGSLISGIVTLQASAWDGVGINRVDFYVDQALAGSSSVYPYTVSWDATLLPAGSTHVIHAIAYDYVGHETVSNVARVTVADMVSPTVRITNSPDDGIVSGVVEVSAAAADNVAVSKVEFYIDGVLRATDTAGPYLFVWDTTNYPHNSSHSIYAKAYDDAGNTGVSLLVSVTVQDISAPTVSITSPVNGSTVPRNSTVTLLAEAFDISGVSKVEFMVNGILKCTDTTSAYSCNWKVPARKNVTYTLQAKAYDIAGNTNINTITVTSK